MTERWRKKLEGLDLVGPSDEVYRRARSDPPEGVGEPPIALPRARTRVVTGVVAFVVFALALSLFVVPALRLGSSGPGRSTTGSIHPLWPMQTLTDVAAWQAKADAGDPSATWATDPKAVAQAFGAEVGGWKDAWAEPTDTGSCLSRTGEPLTPCSMASSTEFGWFSWAPTADPSGSQQGGASYLVWRCDPTVSCAEAPTVTVTLYQPLDQGDGKVWAVLAAASSQIRLDVLPGASLQDGDVVTLDATEPGAHGVVGLHGGSGGCSLDASSSTPVGGSSDPGSRLSEYTLDVALPTAGSGACGGVEAGYVYGTLLRDPAEGVSVDPLRSRVPGLIAMVAVPVAFELPVAAPSGTATPSGGSAVARTTSGPVAPLWPWRTLDEVHAFQRDPVPIFGHPGANAEDPQAIAVAFGESVIGWEHVRAVETDRLPTSLIGLVASVSTHPSATVLPTAAPPSPTKVFALTTCPAPGACDQAWPGPGDVSVVVYQPIGPTGPWAVLEAASSSASVTPAAGTVLNGVVGSGGVAKVPEGYSATFGFRVGEGPSCFAAGQRPGAVIATVPLGAGTSSVEASSFDASSPTRFPDGCDPRQPAYLFVIVTPQPIHPLDRRLDPLEGGLQDVWAFAAVPVVSTVTVGPPPTPSPT